MEKNEGADLAANFTAQNMANNNNWNFNRMSTIKRKKMQLKATATFLRSPA